MLRKLTKFHFWMILARITGFVSIAVAKLSGYCAVKSNRCFDNAIAAAQRKTLK